MTRYEINVARKFEATATQPAYYSHFCRVALSTTDRMRAIEETVEIAKRFPSSEGFSLELMKWTEVGHAVRYLDEIKS